MQHFEVFFKLFQVEVVLDFFRCLYLGVEVVEPLDVVVVDFQILLEIDAPGFVDAQGGADQVDGFSIGELVARQEVPGEGNLADDDLDVFPGNETPLVAVQEQKTDSSFLLFAAMSYQVQEINKLVAAEFVLSSNQAENAVA